MRFAIYNQRTNTKQITNEIKNVGKNVSWQMVESLKEEHDAPERPLLLQFHHLKACLKFSIDPTQKNLG